MESKAEAEQPDNAPHQATDTQARRSIDPDISPRRVSQDNSDPIEVDFPPEDELPKNNMWLVMPALGLMAFISALDQTIIATALPTIAAEFKASPSQYSWVGTAYLLSQTVVTPITGRITDIIGRKPALYTSISVLFIFSALCATAKSIEWLIIARAFTGIGGGAIVGLTTIVISDIVPLSRVGEYQGNLAVAYGLASALGPILGGVFTDRVSWRWCFYINLPCCALSLLCLILTLNLNPATSVSWKDVLGTFDFIGLGLIMTGASLTIIGFSRAADEGFNVPSSYAFITSGVIVLGLTVGHCLITKRNAIIPTRLLRSRTPLFFVLGSFLQSLMLVSAGFLLPQFFQGVRGSNALSAGLQLLPFAIGSALFGVIAGQITSRLRIVRPTIWCGYFLAGLGYILIYITFKPTISLATQEGVQIIASAGIGLSIAPPILVIQAATPFEDRAACTAVWVLMRSLGATTGLAVLTAILNTGMRERFGKIEGYGTVFEVPEGSAGYHAIHSIADAAIRARVLDAFASSMRICFLAGSAFLFGALILTLFTKSYSLNRGQPPSTSASTATDEETAVGCPEKM